MKKNIDVPGKNVNSKTILGILLERIYIRSDNVVKNAAEMVEDGGNLLTIFFGSLVGLIFSWISIGLSMLIKNSINNKNPVRWVLIFAGSAVVLVFFIVILFLFLIAGSIFSIFGLRNIAMYSIKEQVAAWAMILVVVLSAPIWLRDYSLFKVSLIFTYSLGVIGLDFLYGQCGIISLGHAGFLLLGGYATIWLSNGAFGYEFPILFSIIIASAFTGALGFLLGAPSLRIKDYYLVIVTMCFSLAVPKMMKSQYLVNYSGLRQGGLTMRDMEIPQILASVPKAIVQYYFVVIPCLILFWIAYNIFYHSQSGRAFKTIRCDVEISKIMGIPATRYKLMAFVISSAYVGFCGGLLAYLTKFIYPDNYNIHRSIDYMVATVVGGPGTLLGSFMGGVFLANELDLTQLMANLIPRGNDLARASYGLILIVVVFFAPRGIAGEISSFLKSKFISKHRRGGYQVAPPSDYDFLNSDNTKNLAKEIKRDRT